MTNFGMNCMTNFTAGFQPSAPDELLSVGINWLEASLKHVSGGRWTITLRLRPADSMRIIHLLLTGSAESTADLVSNQR